MRFEFIADRPVLDFVATIAERGTANQEKLVSIEDLQDWIEQSGILDDPPELTVADLDRAKACREAFFGVITALINGTAIDRSDRATLNATARGRPPLLQVATDGRIRRSGDLDAVLAALAVDLLDLAGSEDRTRLHWCADARCTRPFVDRSRGGRRRWCGMKGCGDRAKAAAYRERQKLVGHTAPVRRVEGAAEKAQYPPV